MSERTEDTIENKIIEFSKEVLLKFITDKLGGQKAKEAAEKLLDDYTIRFDPSKPREIPGTYYPQFKTTVISSKLIKGDMLETLGTIIHELGHALSDQIATGDKIGKPIEEGFADIISEESLNYFFKVSPEKLREFADAQGLKYKERNYTAGTDYVGESQFIGAILEAIRQRTGKHYEAEFEYILGDKNKFLEIVREALGDACVELIMQQKEEKANVGEEYNLEYNRKLSLILERIPLRYETIQNDEEIRKADRADGTRNVYKLQIIEEIAQKQEQAPLFQEIKRQLQECKDITQVKGLLELENYREIILKNVELLFEAKSIGIEDVFEIIGSDIFEAEKFKLTDEQIKQLGSKIAGVEAEELSPEQIKGLVKIGTKINKPNQQIHDFLSKVEETKPESSLDMQIGIRIAKIRTDKVPNGQDLIAVLENYCNAQNETEISDENYSHFIDIYDMTTSYFMNQAENDPEFLKSTANLLRKLESKVKSGKELSGIEYMVYELRENYFQFVRRDIKTIKSLREVSSISMELEGMEQISQEDLLEIDFSSKIKISSFTTQTPLRSLLFYNKEIKTFDLFNEGTIAQCLEGRLCESAAMEFEGLSAQQRGIYLDVFSKMLEANPNELQDMRTIKELCKNIMTHETDEDKEKDAERKSTFVQTIKQTIRQRKNPIMDLIEMYECKIPSDLKFIYDETISSYAEMVDGNEIGEVPESLMRKLILTARNNSAVRGISTDLLAKQYTSKGLTTENLMQSLCEDRDSGLYYQVIKGEVSEEELKQWLEIRTTAYMKSIGKSENEIQRKALTQLQSRVFEKGKVMHAPQYLKYKKSNGIEDFVVVGTEQEEAVFTALTQDGAEISSAEDISMQQNKGKKGIRALFKKKRDKEIITETMVVGRDGDELQAINRYETGRFEIVRLSMKKSKVKVLDRQDLEPQDIGNNGSLVVKKTVVEKVNVRHGLAQQRDSQQVTMEGHDAKTVEDEEVEV